MHFSSNNDSLSSSFDATGLQHYLSFGNMTVSTSAVISNQEELMTIPDAEEVWIQRFPVTGLDRFVFPHLPSLRTLLLGNNSFSGVSSFELNELDSLEEVIILQKCFAEGSDTLRISNCTSLKSLRIGDESFANYHSLELFNLPSLQSIVIGKSCFLETPLSLTSLLYGDSWTNRPSFTTLYQT